MIHIRFSFKEHPITVNAKDVHLTVPVVIYGFKHRFIIIVGLRNIWLAVAIRVLCKQEEFPILV